MRQELQLLAPDDPPQLLPARRSLSPRRIAHTLVLLGWAALFWFLLETGRAALYLGPRTKWLIPVGAGILSIAAIGRLTSVVTESPESFLRSDARRVGLLLLPLVFVVALPPTALGSYAVAHRSSLVKSGFAGSSHSNTGPVTLGDVAWGLASPRAMRSLVARAGSRVSFIGFVNRSADTPADQFELTRFVITCCVADALSVQVHILDAPPGRFRSDDWVRVTGRLYPLRNEVLVSASSITRVKRPEHPYLNP